MPKWRSSYGRVLWAIAILVIFPLFLFFIACLDAHARDQVQKISKEKLKSMLGRPEVIVLDVRSSMGWEESEYKVKGAIRGDPASIDDWIGDLRKKKTYVLYCA